MQVLGCGHSLGYAVSSFLEQRVGTYRFQFFQSLQRGIVPKSTIEISIMTWRFLDICYKLFPRITGFKWQIAGQVDKFAYKYHEQIYR